MRNPATIGVGARILALGLAAFGASGSFGQEPGVFASPEEKLDYLLDTWRGHTLEELGRIWGPESETRSNRGNTVYVYTHVTRRRTGFSPLSGTITVSRGNVACEALFEVDAEGRILRVARRGGGKTCWNAFRRRETED
jgi:hypothetical protein